MLDVVTSALEVAAVVLAVVALGWVTWLAAPAPWNGPAGLTAAGLSAWGASWGLQAAHARAVRRLAEQAPRRVVR